MSNHELGIRLEQLLNSEIAVKKVKSKNEGTIDYEVHPNILA
jgi:hypothetical protein